MRTIRTILLSTLAYIMGFIVLGSAICFILFTVDTYNISLSKGKMAFAETVVLWVIILTISVIYGVCRKKKPSEFIKRLATFPGRHNYNWQGGYSLFTCLILYTITFFRAISCLQLCKQIYRSLCSSGKDIKSKRPNVSPIFQEVYFIIWMIVLLFQLFVGERNILFYGLDVYFLIESLTWIMYYSFFRRFYEENYSIYHVLEHLPIILILIPLQAIAYTFASSEETVGWKNIFTVLLGQASENTVLFSFVGFMYSAIVISMILSMFPSENIKKGNPDTIIIGAGDVVSHRLLPAYIRREISLPENRRGKVTIYDIEEAGSIESILSSEDIKDLDKIADKVHAKREWEHIKKLKIESVFTLIEKKRLGDDRVAWICTPSDTHWYYLEALQSKADFIAVEKPLTSKESDIARYKDFTQSSKRDSTFFLSYYLLDKALPLTFIARPRDLYLKYLQGYQYTKSGGGDKLPKMRSDEMIKIFHQKSIRSIASGIKSFEMSILEGDDSRKLPEGGQLIETFVHNCIIASLFVDMPNEWEDVRFISKENSKIEMQAKGVNNCDIKLIMEKQAKNNGNEQQFSRIVFCDGAEINADFKLKTAIYKKGKESIKVGVSSAYSGKYDVQCGMVYECYANGLSTSDVDGLYNQIEILEWLFEIKKKNRDERHEQNVGKRKK